MAELFFKIVVLGAVRFIFIEHPITLAIFFVVIVALFAYLIQRQGKVS